MSADVDLAAWRERAEFWTTRDPSTIGHLYDETAIKFAGEVMYLLDRLREAEAAVERVRALADKWERQGRIWPSGFDLRAALTGAQDADERAGASERGRG